MIGVSFRLEKRERDCSGDGGIWKIRDGRMLRRFLLKFVADTMELSSLHPHNRT